MLTRMKFGICDIGQAVERSEQVLAPIRSALPKVSVELVTADSGGKPFADSADLEHALLEGRVDFAIHQLDQLPAQTLENLPLVAYARRTALRYGLVLAERTKKLPKGKPIGCFTRLQLLQLQELYPKHEILLLQEKPAVCLRMFHAGTIGGLVLEHADVDALDLEPRVLRWFAPKELVPAAGVGVLAVQTRRGTDIGCLKAAGDLETAWCALAERAFLRNTIGLTGAYARIEDGMLVLTALVETGEGLKKGDIFGNPQQAAMLGRTLAEHMA